jgi:hypothetical protein
MFFQSEVKYSLLPINIASSNCVNPKLMDENQQLMETKNKITHPYFSHNGSDEISILGIDLD